MSKYYEDTVREAFEDARIIATEEQIDTVISWVIGAAENHGMANGHDDIPSPKDCEIEKLKESHKKEIERLEKRDLQYRKSVASRHNVDASSVYLDDSGNVMVSSR